MVNIGKYPLKKRPIGDNMIKKYTSQDQTKRKEDWGNTYPTWRKFIKEYLLSYDDTFLDSNSILEIGKGGSGSFLKAFIDKIKTVDKLSNLNPDFCIDICHQEIPGLYDVISCCDTLEHTDYPWLAAKNIQKALNPNGIILLTIPCNFTWHPGGKSYGDHWRFFPTSVPLIFDECEIQFESLCEHPVSGNLFPIGFCSTLKRILKKTK